MINTKQTQQVTLIYSFIYTFVMITKKKDQEFQRGGWGTGELEEEGE